MSEHIDCGNCAAKMIIESQSQFIRQLLEAHKKILNPIVKVRTASEAEDDAYVRLWNVKETLLRKYKQVVDEVQRVSGVGTDIECRLVYDSVRRIIGDDVKVERM